MIGGRVPITRADRCGPNVNWPCNQRPPVGQDPDRRHLRMRTPSLLHRSGSAPDHAQCRQSTAFPGNGCRQSSATIDGVDGNAGVDQRRWNDEVLRMMYGGRRAYFARACAGRWPLTDLPTGAKPGTSRPNQWQRWRQPLDDRTTRRREAGGWRSRGVAATGPASKTLWADFRLRAVRPGTIPSQREPARA